MDPQDVWHAIMDATKSDENLRTIFATIPYPSTTRMILQSITYSISSSNMLCCWMTWIPTADGKLMFTNSRTHSMHTQPIWTTLLRNINHQIHPLTVHPMTSMLTLHHRHMILKPLSPMFLQLIRYNLILIYPSTRHNLTLLSEYQVIFTKDFLLLPRNSSRRTSLKRTVRSLSKVSPHPQFSKHTLMTHDMSLHPRHPQTYLHLPLGPLHYPSPLPQDHPQIGCQLHHTKFQKILLILVNLPNHILASDTQPV